MLPYVIQRFEALMDKDDLRAMLISDFSNLVASSFAIRRYSQRLRAQSN